MQFINRFTVFTKRILAHKMYLVMLAVLVFLTGLYKLLPSKEQSTDIKVAICCEDTGEYFDALMAEIERSNSIYTFYIVNSEDTLLNDVKSSYAECGFVIPDNFFQSFIDGTADENPIRMYKTPSSTLPFSICETLFAQTYQIVAEQLMLSCTDLDAYDEELVSIYHDYTSGDEVFRLMDVTDHSFDFKTMIYRINIPVFEITVLLILFAGLLGLLLYQKDKEKRIYLAQNNRNLFQLKALSVLTSLLPILSVGLICNVITYGFAEQVLQVMLTAIAVFFLAMLLSFFIRKSTLIEKVLPLIMLISVISVFVTTL